MPTKPTNSTDETQSRYATGRESAVTASPESVSATKSPLLYISSWRTLIGGGFAFLTLWFGIPALLLLAFLTELIEAEITNRQTTIKLFSFTRSMRDGVRGVGVVSLLFIAPLLSWALYSGLSAFGNSAPDSLLFNNPLLLVLLPITAVALFGAIYASPAVFIESVRIDASMTTFNSHLVGTLTSPHYFLSWWMSVITVIGGFALWSFSFILPPVGLFFGPVIGFYSVCVATVMLTKAVDEASNGINYPFADPNTPSETQPEGTPTTDYPSLSEVREQNNFE